MNAPKGSVVFFRAFGISIPSVAGSHGVRWEVSNTAIAVLRQTGRNNATIEFVDRGVVRVTARSVVTSAIYNDIQVTVGVAATSVNIWGPAQAVVGMEAEFGAFKFFATPYAPEDQRVVWSIAAGASNAEIIEQSNTGARVNFTNVGSVTIRATSAITNTVWAQRIVTISSIGGVGIDGFDNVILNSEEWFESWTRLTAAGNPIVPGAAVTWEVSDPNIATVIETSATGVRLNFINTGVFELTVRSVFNPNIYATKQITVYDN